MPDPNEAPRIYPTFRYRDAAAMIAWLTGIFGFTVRASYKDDHGVVQHAELAFGSSMIMLGTVADDPYGAMVGSDVTPGAKSTYVVVDDPDALFAKAKAAGVRIEEEPTDRSYGSREFIVRDPEGNVWAFGTYWPKAGEAGVTGRSARRRQGLGLAGVTGCGAGWRRNPGRDRRRANRAHC